VAIVLFSVLSLPRRFSRAQWSNVIAAYQLGYLDHLWEPCFAGNNDRNGTELIITSWVSKARPIADATRCCQLHVGSSNGRDG